jgi:Ca2+-binding EF-hand superfamily protein
MAHVKAAERALRGASNLPQPLTVTQFSQKQADASTGAMSSVRKEAAAKQIQSRWRQRMSWYDTLLMTMEDGDDDDDDAAEESESESESATATATVVSAEHSKVLEHIKSKLQALSYGLHGQDPKKLFHHYDRDNSGTIDLVEFTNAMRKGGHLPRRLMNDEQLEILFREVDIDDSGEVNVEEMTRFVWGKSSIDASTHEPSAEGATLFKAISYAAARATRGTDGSGAKWTIPDAQERGRLFDSMANGNGLISMAEFDTGIVRYARHLHHRPSLRRAFVAADTNSDGVIARAEFHQLLHFAVFFVSMSEVFEEMDVDHDGRIDRDEFKEACARLGRKGKTKIKLSAAELERVFVEIDDDGGGFIRFSELCSWSTRYLVMDTDDDDGDAAEADGEDERMDEDEESADAQELPPPAPPGLPAPPTSPSYTVTVDTWDEDPLSSSEDAQAQLMQLVPLFEETKQYLRKVETVD